MTELPEREQALHLLHQMIRIRRFEEKAAEKYSSGAIRGFLHLYIGEEAVAVGLMEALREDDALGGDVSRARPCARQRAVGAIDHGRDVRQSRGL